MTSPFAGRKVGKYRLVEQLGHGMSMVFKAVNIETNQEAALKMVFLGNVDGRELAEFERRGATLQSGLSKDGAPVPALYDSGEADGYFYVAMEYVEGVDLTEIIGRSSLDIYSATRIAVDICEFLEMAQSFAGAVDGKQAHGIVHGDLKPGNIRIRESGKAIIIDLGIAKALSGKSTKNDFASIAYSSPERLKTGKINSLSDMWSAGVVLYEMAVGRRPFNADGTEKLEREIKSGKPIQFPLNCNVPDGLRRIILKALAPNAKMRYSSATAFKEDLQRFQRGIRTLAEDDNEYDYEAPTYSLDDEPPTGKTYAARVGGSYEAWSEPDSEATRRTIQPSQAAQIQDDLKTKPMEQQGSKPSVLHLVKRIAIAALIVITLGLVVNELMVLSAATKLKDELISERLKEMNEAWNRFDALRDRSILRFGLSPVRQPLKEKLIAQADRIFNNYRQTGSLSLKDGKIWQSTQDHISHALEIDSGDNSVIPKLRYAEGFTNFIDGLAKQVSNPPNPQEAKKSFNKAMNLFLEAASLNPQWPDPHIGLAAVYAYGLHDPAKVTGEIEKLKSLNADLGNRAAAMLADSLWTNANDLFSKAGTVRNCNQKIEIYEKAREGYEQAIELYKPMITFGNSAKNLNYAQARINKIAEILGPLRTNCTSEQ